MRYIFGEASYRFVDRGTPTAEVEAASRARRQEQTFGDWRSLATRTRQSPRSCLTCRLPPSEMSS